MPLNVAKGVKAKCFPVSYFGWIMDVPSVLFAPRLMSYSAAFPDPRVRCPAGHWELLESSPLHGDVTPLLARINESQMSIQNRVVIDTGAPSPVR